MKTHGRPTPRPSSSRAKRRSQRLSLRYPLVAYSYSETTGKMRFHESTHTVRVSAHGGMIPLNSELSFGETFILKHTARHEEHPCKVVFLGSDNKSGKSLVGFEFTAGEPDFWHIYFPPMTAKASGANGNSHMNGGATSFYLRD